MPDIRIIGSIAKKHNIKDVQAMLDFLGLKEDINGIVKLYFDSCEQITKMVTGFFNVYQDKTVQSSIQQKFIYDSISSLAVDIVTESIENGYEEKDIRLRLDSISKLIAARFREQLTALNIKDPESALSNFDLAVNSYFKNISVINGHAFIPYTFEGRRIFRHIYMLQNNFHPDSSLRGSSEIVSVSISAVEKQMLVDELSSVDLAKRLIGNMNLDSFAITDPEISLAQYNPSNTYQRAELADDIARFSIPYFREIVIKYSDELFARYGISDLRSLADYADYLESEEDYSNPLLIDVRRIASALKNKEETVGATALFRASIRWLEDTENYLNDIIMQKFASGDYSLTVRDLGSSTGKEAYSIAAVIQQALKRFAQAHLYTDEKSDRERARLIEDWIDNWDIKIFAFDLDFQRLLNVKNGVFILDEEELSFLNKNPQYKGMFSAITGNTATASSRLRKWIKPVYIDLDKDIRILNRYPGEITFAMNLMKYLKSPEEMVAIVKTTSNPVYKSLVVFNRKTYLTPQDHNVFRDQPYVLPPRVQPNVNIISSFVQKTGIASVSTISSIFGLTPAQTADIFESSAILPGRISIDSANKSKRLIESMI